MSKSRSPNYPVVDLGAAIQALDTVFKKEKRNKMSRQVLAQHLGYSSLNGRSLGMIGALRAYGLIEGAGDELRVSEDAITLLNAPEDSEVRREAMFRCAFRPSLFTELQNEFPETPSPENLRFNLIQRQFTPDAAGKALASFLATRALVAGQKSAHTTEVERLEPKMPPTSTLPPPGSLRVLTPPPAVANSTERQLASGLLSRDASFRLLVTGPVGLKEIERLIRKLEVDKEILAEQAESDEGEERGIFG